MDNLKFFLKETAIPKVTKNPEWSWKKSWKVMEFKAYDC